MKFNEKNIVLIETGHTLLLYMLLNDNFDENSVFMFSDKALNKRFENQKLGLEFYYFSKDEYYEILKVKSKLLKAFKKKQFKKNFKNKILETIEKTTKNYKKNFVGHDHIFISRLIWDKIDEFTLLEDGITNYDLDVYLKNKKNRFKSKKNLKLGLSPKVKKIILSGLKKIPKEIKDKVEIVNFQKEWNKKSDKNKEKILSFFELTKQEVDKIQEKKIILCTQPFSDDDVMTEEEEMKMYQRILENYNHKDVLIKIHPRETKTYDKYFPDIMVDTSRVPFEMYEYMGFNFDIVATVSSTTAFSIKNVKKVDFYGTKIHPKLLKEFGNIEYNER